MDRRVLGIDRLATKATHGIDAAVERFQAAPRLEERIETQNRQVNSVLSRRVEAWGLSNAGIYARAPRSVEELGGPEAHIAFEVEDLLKKRKGKRPVVIVDFGGMYSTSMLKLARKFDTAVCSGELLVVSTSLSFHPEGEDKEEKLQYIFSDGFLINGSLPAEEVRDFVRGNLHRVQYVNCNAFEFADIELEVPNFGELRLGDGVDFIHEAWSLSLHSLLLDLEYPSLGSTLKPGGLMMLENVGRRCASEVVIQAQKNLNEIGLEIRSSGGYDFVTR